MLMETKASAMFPTKMVQQDASVWEPERETAVKIRNYSEMSSTEKHLGNKLTAEVKMVFLFWNTLL